MKKTALKSIFLFILFIFFFIATSPKENLYFYLEKELEKQQIIISDESIDSSIFKLDINNPSIYYNNIKFADIQNINLNIYLFTNKIDINKIKVEDNFKKFLPNNIQNINISYSLYSLQAISIEANSDIGKIKGEFNLFSRNVTLELLPNKKKIDKYKMMLKFFKLKDGRYIYENQL